AFCGGFVIFALVGAQHQDARKIATNVPGYREFCAATPFLPFTGGETLRGLREAAPAAVMGVAATVVGRYCHAAWFGGVGLASRIRRGWSSTAPSERQSPLHCSARSA